LATYEVETGDTQGKEDEGFVRERRDEGIMLGPRASGEVVVAEDDHTVS